jgi:hypothetical protein
MKKFKTYDCMISTGLIISFIAINVMKVPESLINETVLTGYFVVGGWQVISMVVHAQTTTFTEKPGKRYAYHWITFISLMTMPLGSFWILLFTAPFMAVYYTWLCFDEVRKMNERPLAMLK